MLVENGGERMDKRSGVKIIWTRDGDGSVSAEYLGFRSFFRKLKFLPILTNGRTEMILDGLRVGQKHIMQFIT